MKQKKLLSLILSAAMFLSIVPKTALADGTASVNVNITAQSSDVAEKIESNFLYPPQMNISVAADTAEKYGFTDDFTYDESGEKAVYGKVSALDALVRLHEIMYGDKFTDKPADYLEVSYGYVTKIFGDGSGASVFVLNGAYPNDGEKNGYYYNGTTVETQALSNGDNVDFVIVGDKENWTDELAWFNYKGSAAEQLTVAPGSKAALTLNSIGYAWYAGMYADADALHTAGVPAAGAQLAYVNAETGALADIDSAVTGSDGKVTITAPDTEGTYYITAYRPVAYGGAPLIMQLTKLVVSNDAVVKDVCTLSSLSVTSLESSMAALELTPAFSPEIMSYSVPAVGFNSGAAYRIVFVKAAAQTDDAVITAECNDAAATLTSGDSNWKALTGALENGKNNILKVTVSVNNDKKVYRVKIPMEADPNAVVDTGYPSSVESYLPAPGQFVNTADWQNAEKTLTGEAGITLGAFGGNVVYKYDNPIKNDPKNPYGIDFIVFGNCNSNSESTAAGSAEPGAVMVSKDGETWYELAGSEYYTASARHNIGITYTNGDTGFTEAADTAWETTDGESGVLPKNSYHSQPYYPNPEYYGNYQNGTGKNTSFTAETVSFSGTVIENGFYPFGYADSHAAKSGTAANAAVNPYGKNHLNNYNGDGFDLDWAVDSEGNPVELDEISYIKIYTAVLDCDAAMGEKSTEVTSVLRAAAAEESVGKSAGLASLTVNGKTIEPDENNTYTFDAENASVLKITPAAKAAGANIYVSNQYVKSGDEATVTAVKKLRIIVQEDNCEPAIYILNSENILSTESNAELVSLTLTPGDDTKTPSDTDTLSFTVANNVSSVRFAPKAFNKKSAMTLSGGGLTEAIALTDAEQSKAAELAVGENVFTLTVTSQDGKNEKSYTVTVTRESGSSSGSTASTISVKFTLTGDTAHYDKASGTYTGAHTSPEWISRQTVRVPKNSTVKYLTELMLNNAGISYTTDGVYISEIKGLAEFENGKNSGWLYRVNGYISDEGYADKKLSDGDTVLWFYTDDYTKESGYEGSFDTENTSGGSSKKHNSKKPTIVTDTTNTAENTDVLGAFGDVDAGAWYANAVEYAVKNGLLAGVSENEFAPEEFMTRAMLVTVLYRLDGAQGTGGANPFSDVPDGEWYTEAVVWASENGIVSGVSEDKFAPNDGVTREQLAAVLYRYAQMKGYDVTQGGMRIREFEDYGGISEYALQAMSWAVNAGIIQGSGDNLVLPTKTAARAEVAAIMMRFCENIIKA